VTRAPNFATEFEIDGRRVGGDAPLYFIAEAGVAHFGDHGKAMALVDLAAEAGADAFKTQAYTTDRLIASTLPDWRERMRIKEVGFDFIAAMKERCDRKGLTFLCTPHDDSALEWLDRLGVTAYKIGSGERGNLPFIRAIAERDKPIVLSTGMYALDDVRSTLAAAAQAGCRQMALLHCVTSYPTPPPQVNLRAMDELRSVFIGPVGYSDHTTGDVAVIAAAARGAKIIEKHIALDFNVPNAHDWKVSAGPDDLAQLISDLRATEAMLGDGRKLAQPCEETATQWALKRLVASGDLAAGERLTADRLVAKRAATGLSPDQLDAVVGRRLRRAVRVDEAITWDDLTTE
jgi:N,N'-diacetyllegionaminate synthase